MEAPKTISSGFSESDFLQISGIFIFYEINGVPRPEEIMSYKWYFMYPVFDEFTKINIFLFFDAKFHVFIFYN